MNSNNNQTLDGLTGYNSDPIVVPEVFNCDTTQEQGQEHDDSRKIAAVDPADCTTGHELSQANLHHPIPQYDISHFPPLGQLFYVYLPGGYVGSYMVSTDGWFQTGLHGPYFPLLHGSQPSVTESFQTGDTFADTNKIASGSDDTDQTVPLPDMDSLLNNVPVPIGMHPPVSIDPRSIMPPTAYLPPQVQPSVDTICRYHEPPNNEPSAPVVRVQQQLSVTTQRDLRDEYYNPYANQLSFEDMTNEFRAIPESQEPRERRSTGTLSCLQCVKDKKRCADGFPCQKCSEKNDKKPKRRFPPRSRWREEIEADLDEIISSNTALLQGILKYDGKLHRFSDLSQWDDLDTIRSFFLEYDGDSRLSHKRMIAYFHTTSPKSKSYRSLSNEFVPRALKTPFARGLIAYANETCPNFNVTVAEWCKQRLQVAKDIFRTTETGALLSDEMVKDLCYALQIISWSKHSTCDCAHMVLCDRASQVFVHGIAKLAQMPCSEAHVEELSQRLDEQMDLFIKRRQSMIFTDVEDWTHSPAKGLQRLIEKVKQSVSNKG